MISNKTVLTSKAAEKIVHAAMRKAEENGWNVSIAIVDDAGRLLYFVRMDSTTNASVEVAISKAVHAANFNRDTKFHQELLEKGNPVVAKLPGSMPLAGGLRLVHNGSLLGGIGVSGVAAEDDEKIARAGLDALEQMQ